MAFFWFAPSAALRAAVASINPGVRIPAATPNAERAIASAQAAANDVAGNAARARDRVERLRRGEDVPGFDKVLTREDLERILRDAGLTTADIRHMATLGELPEEALPVIRDAALAASKRAERATARRLVRWQRTTAEQGG